MKKFFPLILPLLLLLPLSVYAAVNISSDPTFNPLENPLVVTISPDTSFQNADLRVFTDDGLFSRDLIIRDSLGRSVYSLNPGELYTSTWSGLDDLGAPLDEGQYFLGIARGVGANYAPSVTDTRIDWRRKEPEFTRSELLPAFPKKPLDFVLFKNLHDVKKFVLVLEADALYDKENIDLTSIEVEGLDPNFITINPEKTYKLYPNELRFRAKQREVALIRLEKKLRDLKKKRDVTDESAITAHVSFLDFLELFNKEMISVTNYLSKLNGFTSDETFFKRSKTAFEKSLSNDARIALSRLVDLNVIRLGEPYVVSVRVALPEKDFEKEPFTISGKIKFKYLQFGETVVDFEVKKFDVEITSEVDKEQYDEALRIVKETLGVYPPKFVNTHLDGVEFVNISKPPEGKKLFFNASKTALENELDAKKKLTSDFFKIVMQQHPELSFIWSADSDLRSFYDFAEIIPEYKAALVLRGGEAGFDEKLDALKEIVNRASGREILEDWWINLEDVTKEELVISLLGPNAPNAVVQEALKQDLSIDELKELRQSLDSIKKILRGSAPGALNELNKPRAASLFVKNPNSFIEIARGTGGYANDVFSALQKEKFAHLFEENPEKVVAAFGQVTQAVKENAYCAFFAIDGDEAIADLFVKYGRGEINFNQLMVHIYAYDVCAIELGGFLDTYSDRNLKDAYLNQLSDLQIFGLLLSNPKLFYASSNRLLFDKFKRDLISKKPVTQWFNDSKVLPEFRRNFIFRSINYDRFYGKYNSLFSKNEMGEVTRLLLEPINSNEFDGVYYYLLANALDKIANVKGLNLKEDLVNKLNNRLTKLKRVNTDHSTILKSSDNPIVRALEFLLFNLDEKAGTAAGADGSMIEFFKGKSSFYPWLYFIDGKLQVLQIFDRADTQRFHWPDTQKLFEAKMGKPTVGANGELIYENAHARVILFMGRNDEKNREFTSTELDKNPSQIIVFRGHSYSLDGPDRSNFPYDIFGNRFGQILFIPGSCGSAASTPLYINENPRTDLVFISNASTGRGRVTNVIVNALIDLAKNKNQTTEFSAILASKSREIKRLGTDPDTIKVYSLGEALLDYVFA